jgi:YD repeat-containing protein
MKYKNIYKLLLLIILFVINNNIHGQYILNQNTVCCPNETYVYTASEDNNRTYVWAVTNGTIVSGNPVKDKTISIKWNSTDGTIILNSFDGSTILDQMLVQIKRIGNLSLTATDTRVCSGESTTLTISGKEEGIIKYWQYRSPGGTWYNVSGITSTVYSPTLTADREFRVYVQNPCNTTGVYSNTISIDVNTDYNYGEITRTSPVGVICNTGTAVSLLWNNNGSTNLIDPEEWLVETTTGTWVNVGHNTNHITYTITKTDTKFKAIVRNLYYGCLGEVEYNVHVETAPVPGQISPSSQTVCANTSYANVLSLTGYSGITSGDVTWYTVERPVGHSPVYTQIGTGFSVSPGNHTSTTEYVARIQAGECLGGTVDRTAFVYVDQVPVGGSLSGSGVSFCENGSGTLTLSGYSGDIINWQRSINGGSWSSLGVSSSSYSYAITALNNTVIHQYRVVVDNGVCNSVNSQTATITVYPKPVVSPGEDITTCDKTNLIDLNTPDVSPLGGTWINSNVVNGHYFDPQNLNTGEYIINYLVDVNGCQNQASRKVILIECVYTNYILIEDVLVKDVLNETTLDALDENSLNKNYTFFDGLGRESQSLLWRYSPDRMNFVQAVVYDNLGRKEYNLLPYVSTSSSGSYDINATKGGPESADYITSNQYLFYQQASEIEYSTYPYARTVFEPSPLNRVFEQGLPGEDWRIAIPFAEENKTIEYVYRGDNPEEVIVWNYTYPDEINRYGMISVVDFYWDILDECGLFVTETYDEEDNATIEYKNKKGQVILKKTISADLALETKTYYVYDDFGNLRFVLPPEFLKAIEVDGESITQELLDKWTYQYKYDGRHRMIEKKLPGAEAVYMVYDDRDRLVATQDGNLRNNINGSYWLFTKYDVFNRPVMTGMIALPGDQSELQLQVNTFYDSPGTVFYESAGTAVHGYTNVSWPDMLTVNNYLTVTYYDTYQNLPVADFPQGTYGIKDSPVLEDINNDNIPDEYYENIKGLVAGTKTKVLDGLNTWTHTVDYYDKKSRVIQTIADIYQDGISGQEVMSNAYNFVGQPIKTEYVHEGTETVTITKRYAYDHTGRLLKVYHKINDNPEVLMSSLKYNELGEMIEKNLHSSDVKATEQTAFWQSVDYRYNIRGWLKSINNTGLDNTPSEGNDDTNDLFGFEIKYNDPF